jgi:DNA-binding NtrC family response regulator
MSRERVLVIDADPTAGAALRAALAELGFDSLEAASCEAGLALVPSVQPAVVLADCSTHGSEGVALAPRLAALGSDASLVVVVTSDRLDLAVAALHGGAEAFLVRPIEPTHVAVVLQKASEKRRLRLEGARMRERLRGRLTLVGTGPEVLAIHEVIRRVAPTKATVLVQG